MDNKNEELKGKVKEKEGELKGKTVEKKGETKLKENKTEKSEEKIVEKKEDVSTGEFKEASRETKSNTEKILSDLLERLREKEEECGEKISYYAAHCETPLTDVLENDTEIIIRMDLPGVEKDDIAVYLTEEAVEVMAIFPGKGEPGQYNKRERNYGKTSRSIELSKKIKEKEATSTFKDSILTIKLPKLVKDRYKMEIK
jgi:HSP20 family protein